VPDNSVGKVIDTLPRNGLILSLVSALLTFMMERGRVNLSKQRREIDRLRAEMSAKPRDQRVVTTRAVARIVEDVHLEGRMGKFVVEADEPVARGGTEKGASPLQFVMMGTAF
jgi:hypothetical protein